MAAQGLIVISLPRHEMSFTNCVYVNPSSPLAPSTTPTFVEIEKNNQKYVFKVDTFNEIKVGEFGMNGLQRQSANIQQGEKLNPRLVDVNKEAVLAHIQLQLELVSRRKTFAAEDQLAAFVKNIFANQILNANQQLALEFEGTTFKLIVTDNMSETVGESKDKTKALTTKSVTRGRLANDTIVQIIPLDNKLLEWEPSQTGTQANLFTQKMNFEALGIGGLDEEFEEIFRRAFVSRLFPGRVKKMGIPHVKGMLLYGPPGTGKTLIARQIGKVLNGHEPKVVNGPEILNKYVGASEENIRKLFEDAEKEYAERKDASKLHIIIFDEIDAICKQRGSVSSGTGVHDTVVNQLLSKIDGVNALNNIFVIGMTNRKDLIDDALLRPGRLEVHMQISLPDIAGRLQILKIHTKQMRENGVLDSSVDLDVLAEQTKNFSGAEIQGLVKSAASFALTEEFEWKDLADGKMPTGSDDVIVTMRHFELALKEVKPAFGVSESELLAYVRSGIVNYGAEFDDFMNSCRKFARQVQLGSQTPLLSVLLEGPVGSGKTAIAAQLAIENKEKFPFIKFVSPENMVGFSETAKSNRINSVFEDAYKSPFSIIIVDNLERLLEYVPIGPRFSNTVLQTILVLIRKIPPNPECRLLVIATTSNSKILDDMQMKLAFNVIKRVPMIHTSAQVKKVLSETKDIQISSSEADHVASVIPYPIGIKQLNMLVEMTKEATNGQITAATIRDSIRSSGMDRASDNDSIDYDALYETAALNNKQKSKDDDNPDRNAF